MDRTLVPDVARIAVLRANAIGDFLFTLPALEALRAAYPAAELTLLGTAWHAAFVHGRPGPVDRVVPVPPSPGVWLPRGAAEDPGATAAFFDAMRAERFDLAVQLHGGGRWSNPFVGRLGARVTAGLRAEDAEPLDRWARYVYWQHEITRSLEAVSLVGAGTVTIEPRVAVVERDRQEAVRVLGDCPRPLVVLNPGATDPRRRWPPERLAAVGDALAGAGATVVVSGDDGDRALADAVVEAMRKPARSIAGTVSLGGLAAVLEQASVVISNDTGPLHLARAVGTATVGIYWCGNLVNAGPLQTHLHRVAVSWQLDCSVCGQNCMRGRCPHDEPFVLDVEVDDVVEPALDLLALVG